jgi:hypothetical protein
MAASSSIFFDKSKLALYLMNFEQTSIGLVAAKGALNAVFNYKPGGIYYTAQPTGNRNEWILKSNRESKAFNEKSAASYHQILAEIGVHLPLPDTNVADIPISNPCFSPSNLDPAYNTLLLDAIQSILSPQPALDLSPTKQASSDQIYSPKPKISPIKDNIILGNLKKKAKWCYVIIENPHTHQPEFRVCASTNHGILSLGLPVFASGDVIFQGDRDIEGNFRVSIEEITDETGGYKPTTSAVLRADTGELIKKRNELCTPGQLKEIRERFDNALRCVGICLEETNIIYFGGQYSNGLTYPKKEINENKPTPPPLDLKLNEAPKELKPTRISIDTCNTIDAIAASISPTPFSTYTTSIPVRPQTSEIKVKLSTSSPLSRKKPSPRLLEPLPFPPLPSLLAMTQPHINILTPLAKKNTEIALRIYKNNGLWNDLDRQKAYRDQLAEKHQDKIVAVVKK